MTDFSNRTCVVTLYRQTTLPSMDLTDVTSSGLLAFLASTIEIAIAISIACLPFLRALWHRGSSHHGGSSNNYEMSGSSGAKHGKRLMKSDGFGHLPGDSESRLQHVEHYNPNTQISAAATGTDEEGWAGTENRRHRDYDT